MGQRKKYMWTLLRQTDVENKKDPNSTRNKIKTTQVSYLSTVNAPPTNLSTVNKILNQTMKIARKLDVKVVFVFDQALHAKVIYI